MCRTTLLQLFTSSKGPGSGMANFIVSLLSSKCAFFSGTFSTNMVRVLPFTPSLMASSSDLNSMHTLSSSPAERETTLLWLFTPSKGPGSGKANFIVNCSARIRLLYQILFHKQGEGVTLRTSGDL